MADADEVVRRLRDAAISVRAAEAVLQQPKESD